MDHILVEDDKIDNKEYNNNEKNKKYKIIIKNIYEEIVELKKNNENKIEKKQNNRKTLIKKDSIWFDT